MFQELSIFSIRTMIQITTHSLSKSCSRFYLSEQYRIKRGTMHERGILIKEWSRMEEEQDI